jgi:hypothetical protein
MDSVIRSKIHYQEHDGQLTHETSQPTEGIILDRNAELRKNAGSLRDLGAGQEGGAWGRQVATIPFITYDWALRNNFDLNSTDKAHAGLEMNRFLSTPEGKACLVQG